MAFVWWFEAQYWKHYYLQGRLLGIIYGWLISGRERRLLGGAYPRLQQD